MHLQGEVERLTIFLDGSDQWHHRPLYLEIVHRAHRAGLAGATVLRGIEGFTAISGVHTPHLLRLGDHLPVAIIIVDTPQRIDAFIEALEDVYAQGVISKGIMLRDTVEVIGYRPEPGG